MKASEFLKQEMGVLPSDIPERIISVLVGVEPKYKCKNPLIQKLLLKLFGEKPIFEERQARVLEIKAEDYPYLEFDGNFIIDFQKDGEDVNSQ